MKHKVLVYAFSSFGGAASNISEQILKRLTVIADKLLLKVRFVELPYRDIAANDYDMIVGMGQYPRGKRIRIERFAHNLWGSKAKGYTQIEKGGLEKIELDLKLSPIQGALPSDDAGRFVCNFSMYTLMRLKKKTTKLAFLHIPKQVEVDWATEVVGKLLSQVGVQ